MHNYIKNHVIEEINDFKEKINKETVSISIFNNIFFSTLLVIFIYINNKKNIIANKMWVDYIAYLPWHKTVI